MYKRQGLIYDIQILPLDNVHILMTLTSPNGGNPNIWEDELNEYLDDPTDEKKEDLNKKLRLLLKELCLMPEYHLS